MNKQTEITKLRFREQELLLDKDTFTITEINNILLEVDSLFNNESSSMTTNSDTSTSNDNNSKTPEQFFKSIMSKITGTKKIDNYPYYVYHMVGDKIYIEQDLKNNNFYIRSEDFWSVFETKFNLNYQETSELLRDMLEEYLKCKVNTTLRNYKTNHKKLEEHLKCKVNTTI